MIDYDLNISANYRSIDKIPVLAYHGIRENISYTKTIKYNITIESFSRQIKLLYDCNYRTVSLDNLVSWQKSSTAKTKDIIITFDDGHVSNITNVLPVLEKYNYKAIFFVTTGLIENQIDFMDWKQVRELSRKGHDVQSHGHTHRFLNQLSRGEIRNELEKSGEIIYNQTDKKPITFSCPGGRFDKRAVEIAKAIGYQKMFISRPGYLNDCNSFSVDRWIITTNTTLDNFNNIIEFDKLFLAKSKIIYFMKYVLKVAMNDKIYNRISELISNGKR